MALKSYEADKLMMTENFGVITSKSRVVISPGELFLLIKQMPNVREVKPSL
jgi:hypothetical protein